MSRDWRRILGAAAISLVAMALRVPLLDRALWMDEQITLSLLQRFDGVALATNIFQHQPHFPTYYILADAMVPLVGVGGLRWASVFASALTAGLAFAWARPRLGLRAWLIGGTLACSPLLIEQAYWMRMYALLLLAATLSWFAAHRLVEDETGALAYAVTATATISLHPFGLFTTLSQVFWMAYERGRIPRRAVFGVGGGGSVFAVVLATKVIPGIGGEAEAAGHINYIDAPVLRAALTPVATLTGTIYGSPHPALLFTALVGMVALSNRVWESRLGRMALAWALVPLPMIAVAHAVHPVWLLKYLGWLAPGVALLLAVSIQTRLDAVSIGAGIAVLQVLGLRLLADHRMMSKVVLFAEGALQI